MEDVKAAGNGKFKTRDYETADFGTIRKTSNEYGVRNKRKYFFAFKFLLFTFNFCLFTYDVSLRTI